MKNLLIISFFLLSTVAFSQSEIPRLPSSAWQTQSGDTVTTLIFAGRYFVETSYDLKNKKFFNTIGGVWRSQNGNMDRKFEFNTVRPDLVGSAEKMSIEFEERGIMKMNPEDQPTKERVFKLLDEGKPGKLAGAWAITGRMQNGEFNSITPGDRITMKILSGTRFQWIAYNRKTAEFFGTGGGTYTTENGKYTENLEFFSRDNSRVGASLQFDFSLESDNWRHQGLSSKGDPIDEVWSKRGN